MHVTEIGTPDAPSIVFLHGGGVGGWMWRGQTHALDDYHCLVPDLPGHGQSRTLPWVSIADTAQRTGELIEARATNGRAHVVGLSLGAHVVLALLAQAPALVDHAVLSGLNVLPVPQSLQLIANLMQPLATTSWMLRVQAKALKIGDDVYGEYVETARALAPDTLRRIGAEAYNVQLPPHLGEVLVPTLIAAGEKEVKLVHRSMPILLRTLPHAQGCIAPGAGHGWNGEAPALFSDMVRAWINDVPLPAALTPVSPRTT
jgi:pimeloyl-ACP methyl ester carboxylesterase